MPSVQKKTGPVKKDVKEVVDENGDVKSEEETKPAKRKRASKVKEEELEAEDAQPAKKGSKGKKQKVKQEGEPATNGAVKEESSVEEESKTSSKKRKPTTEIESNGIEPEPKKQVNAKSEAASSGRRRSTRKSGGAS